MLKIVNFKLNIIKNKKWRNNKMAKKVKYGNSLISLNLPGPQYES